MKTYMKTFWLFFLILNITSAIALIITQTTDAHAAETKKEAAYVCPMHPGVTSDKPGDCPICHMRLVPIKRDTPPAPAAMTDPNAICLMHNCSMEKDGKKCSMLVLGEKGEKISCPVCGEYIRNEEGAYVPAEALTTRDGYSSILITPERQQLIGIRTSLVEKKEAQTKIRAAGRIAYDPDLYQAQSEYLESFKSLEMAKKNNDSSAMAWASKLMESARIKLMGMGLNAQVIQSLETQEGPDKSLLYAVPEGQAWVYANIYEYEIPSVKIGDELNIEAASAQNTPLKGNIRAIDTVVDPATRTVRVRAQVKNTGGVLRPDMYVNVSLETKLGKVLLVPEEAIFFTGKANLVFVEKGPGLFEPRHLILGSKAGEYYAVIQGLTEGEKVVTSGNFLVDSESKLKAALSSVGGHSHGS